MSKRKAEDYLESIMYPSGSSVTEAVRALYKEQKEIEKQLWVERQQILKRNEKVLKDFERYFNIIADKVKQEDIKERYKHLNDMLKQELDGFDRDLHQTIETLQQKQLAELASLGWCIPSNMRQKLDIRRRLIHVYKGEV
jgi:phage-related tail protein